MDDLIKLWKRTVVGSECDWWDDAGKVDHAYCKDKAQAFSCYNAMKQVWTNVWVFDPDGEYCDPTEL